MREPEWTVNHECNAHTCPRWQVLQMAGAPDGVHLPLGCCFHLALPGQVQPPSLARPVCPWLLTQMLLAAEGVDLHFTDAAIAEIAGVAEVRVRL